MRMKGTYIQAEKDGQAPTLACPGCGFRETMRLPLPVDQMCDIVEGFQRRHAGCKKGRKAGGGGR